MSVEPTPPPFPALLERDAAVRYPVEAEEEGLAAARDVRVGRTVAVKRMIGEISATATERFVREARLQGRLEHPAIVPVLDVGVDPDGRAYFVQREVRGATLAAIIAERVAGGAPRWSTRRLLAAFVDVCLAIEYAHSRGVVHRDLRPEHVTLGDFGEVYVREWGRAALAADGTAPAPGYAAPEQVIGEPDIDARADVYALGCLLFEILCQRPLHPTGEAALESTLAGVDVHAAARAAGRHGPPELLDACAAATRTRGERTTTARALADAVHGWLDGVRDLARRRELAARHSMRARAAHDKGDNAVAMREAAAAVALSPDASAAELLGRLLLEPPADGSPDGDAISEASDVAEIRAQAKVATLSFLAIPAFLPLLAWLGFRDFVVPTVIAALAIVQSAQAWAAANSLMRARLWVWTSYALNIVILAFFTRIFGVAIAVPAMVLTLVAAGASIPGVRAWWVVPTVLTVTVFGPALLEASGLLARTVTATGDALVISSTVVHLPRGPTLVVLAIHTVALLFVGVNYGRQLTRVNREARLRLRAQAWHLEQIVDSR